MNNYFMRIAVLLSGGKDSLYSAYLAKKQGHELTCLISVYSENTESYMFHTPSIEKTKKQAQVMNIPLIIQKTKGEKEKELKDLFNVIKKTKKEYCIKGIVTGAIESVYQKSRIQKICKQLELKCINPLWKKNSFKYLEQLIKNNFKAIITGVFAYPFDKTWLGKQINSEFIEQIKILNNKYKIHPAGEGGEYETFVLNCPLFNKEIKIKSFKDIKEGENSWRREIKI